METLFPLIQRPFFDYLENNGISTSRSKGSTAERLDAFLNNPANRRVAEERAFLLWSILTNNAPIEEASKRVLSKSLINKMTTLKDYGDINKLLEFLEVFGFIEYTKDNASYEFKIIFGSETRRAVAKVDIIDLCGKANAAIIRYKSLLKENSSVSEDEFADELINLRKNIDEIIKF